MWLRIIDIDLDASCVHLEVAPDESEAFFAQLDTFSSRCAAEGMVNIRVFYRRGTSKRNLLRLKDFCAMNGFEQPVRSRSRSRSDGDDAGTRERFRSEVPRRRARPESGRPRVLYQIGIDDLGSAVETVTTATGLICAAENLGTRSSMQLRLCVYELVMNSVEHGAFAIDTPTICLALQFTEDRVLVSYRDNADAFLTISPTNFNLVEEQINANRKRGLGLYMLNKICADIEYEREDEWNITLFTLDLNREQVPATER